MTQRTNTAKWNGKRWRIDVQKDGARKSFYSSTPGRAGQREAHEKADKWLDDGISTSAGRVADIYAQWLDTDIKKTTSFSNWQPLTSRWNVWILPAIGHRKLQTITDNELQKIINNAHAAGRSRKTLQSLAADLRAFFKYCRRCRYTNYTPLDIKIPAGARYKGKQVLQPRDLLLLFNRSETTWRGKAAEDEYINAYRFQVLTGLRPGELMGLLWEDVQGNRVYIRRAINVHGDETQGKNQNAVRSFILTPQARRVLDAQREQTGEKGSVFCIEREQHYCQRWKAFCAYNGITPVTPYELRHTFVSAVKTLPAGEVKSLVGHSRDMDTFGVYGHALIGDAENTAHDVAQVFDQIMKKA